jgi:ribosomal protein S12 methylthiotransferase accessory factor
MPFAAQRDCHDTDTKNFLSKVFEASKVAENRSIAWIKARRLPDGAETWFPLDLCCRRPAGQQNFAPPLKLSTGCAAGETFEAAALRAALELVERDAAALWWRGGCRGHPIAPDSDAGQAAAALLAAARQGKGDRQTWLLDITTDIEIPAVAALSAREDGYGFAFGFAARLAIADAARAALFELFQVELGQHVVAAKRHESGEGALNENDRRQWRRASLFNTRGCALLEPDGAPNPASPGVPDEPTAGLRHIVERLHAHDIRAYALDLTRPDLGVPVVRVLAPGLQLEPCQIAGARLAAAIRATGGGGVHTGGLPLL